MTQYFNIFFVYFSDLLLKNSNLIQLLQKRGTYEFGTINARTSGFSGSVTRTNEVPPVVPTIA